MLTSTICAHLRKTQGLSSPHSIHVPNLCNTSHLQYKNFVASHTHWGEEVGSQGKLTRQNKFEGNRKGLCVYSSCSVALGAPSHSWLLPALSAVPVCSPLVSTALYRFLFWCLLSEDRQAQGRECSFKHINIYVMNTR